jgi:hypothetical protein
MFVSPVILKICIFFFFLYKQHSYPLRKQVQAVELYKFPHLYKQYEGKNTWHNIKASSELSSFEYKFWEMGSLYIQVNVET